MRKITPHFIRCYRCNVFVYVSFVKLIGLCRECLKNSVIEVTKERNR